MTSNEKEALRAVRDLQEEDQLADDWKVGGRLHISRSYARSILNRLLQQGLMETATRKGVRGRTLRGYLLSDKGTQSL